MRAKGYDYRRDGARTVFNLGRRRWFVFMHDRASWHLNRVATVGLAVTVRPRLVVCEASLWRWSLSFGRRSA